MKIYFERGISFMGQRARLASDLNIPALREKYQDNWV